jgi:Ca2+/Na+ antiporter
MVAVSVLLMFFAWDGNINGYEGVLLVFGLLDYTSFLFYQSKTQVANISGGPQYQVQKSRRGRIYC